MRSPKETQILDSWRINADAWADAIRNDAIASRLSVTNHAIVSTVAEYSPAHVLDIGCGEGWLARRLESIGIRVTGIDAVAALVAQARAGGAGHFTCCAYEDLIAGRYAAERFDGAICNFSLLGGAVVDALIGALPALLGDGGLLFIQTLHPRVACGSLPYEDGWRDGSWDGFGPAFRRPAPWYFRTIESWRALLEAAGFALLETKEPRAPLSVDPSSMIFVGRRHD